MFLILDKRRKMRFILLAAAVILSIILTVILLNLSILKLQNAEIIYPGGSSNSFAMPFEDTSAPTGDFLIKGVMTRNLITPIWVHIIPDDKFLYLKVNAADIPLDQLNSGSLQDYYTGFYFELGKYLKFGKNRIEIGLRNYGGRSALEIKPDYSHALITDILIAILFILSAIMISIPLLFFNLHKKMSGNQAVIIAVLLGILSVLICYYMKDYGSGDFSVFLGWHDYIKNHNGIFALKDKFYDYTPLFIYLITFAVYLPIKKALAIKLIYFLFEILASVYAALIVNERTGSWDKAIDLPVIAFYTILFSPTMILNTQMWGQCDIIYTGLIIASIYYIIKHKLIAAFIFLGFALSFKLQSVFITPLYFFLLIKKEIHWKYFLLIPAAYISSFIPCILLGRPVQDMYLIYVNQASAFGNLLSYGCANFYQWLSPGLAGTFVPAGIILTTAAVFIISLALLRTRRFITNDLVIKLSLISVLIIPFLLPRMHERYYFAADIISIIFAFYFPKYFYLPVIIILISFLSYGPFLMGLTPPVALPILSIGILTAIIMILYDLMNYLFPSKAKRQTFINKFRKQKTFRLK